MQQLLQRLEEQKNWKQFLKKSCRRNKIPVEIASYFTPLKIRSIYDRFEKSYSRYYFSYQTVTEDDKACWLENQLKTFHWCLVSLSGLKERLIENFVLQQQSQDDQVWTEMLQIFKDKDTSTLQYESIKLVNQRLNKNRQWNEEETEILTQIIKSTQQSNKWNDVARSLFQKSSGKYFRSGKQCRERWLNHLDPTKKRGDWDEEQDNMIVNFILRNGKRWSNLAKELGSHRTQHMVKNRFKTLIIRQKKLTPRISNDNSLLKEIGKRINGQDVTKKDAFESSSKKLKSKQEQKPQQSQQRNTSKNTDKNISDENKSPFQLNPRPAQNCQKQQQNQSRQGFSPVPQRNSVTLIQQIPKEDQKILRDTNAQPSGTGSGLITDKRSSLLGDSNNFNGSKEGNFFRDPVISQVIEQCNGNVNHSGNLASTPHSYEMQQVYSPFVISYQSNLTSNYLSPSPSLPFFMNSSSFSAFDNQFNQNLFIQENRQNGASNANANSFTNQSSANMNNINSNNKKINEKKKQ